MEERLQKLLSRCGIASRRQAEAMIAAGRVQVNGQVAALGASADLERDEILLDGKPVIGLTLRYDRLDNFWHTLMHELGHLYNGDVSEEPVFDDLEISAQEDNQEVAADMIAQNVFIPRERWESFCAHRVSTMSICALAALTSRTCACSISEPMALTKASKLLFSMLLSLLLIVVCIESYKGKPNYRFSMKLADCFLQLVEFIHCTGFHIIGDVDVGFHSLVVGCRVS